MTRLNAANNAQTLLVGDITDSAESFYVEDASVFPAAPFLISIDDEIMQVNTVLGNLLSDIDRAQEDTTAAAHEGEALVENRWTAGMYAELAADTPKNNFTATTDPGVGDDSADGYSVGSRWVNTSNGKAYTCLDATEGAAVWQAGGAGGVLNKYDAAVDPTVNDDSGDGYSVGSVWINVTDDTAFVCLDATAGAAKWEQISGLIAHLAETVSKVVLVTEPYDQVTKTTVNLGFRPKLVNIAGVIVATNYESYGFADATGQNCLNSVVKTAVVKSISSAVMVAFTYDATNYLHGIVTITATGIEIAWTLEGTLTGASGNRRIIISAITH